MSETTVPRREEVTAAHRWSLASLYESDAAWESAFADFRTRIPETETWRGRLAEGAASLRSCLHRMMELGRTAERLGHYAHLRLAEDAGDSARQDRYSRFVQASSAFEAAASYQAPEIQAIPDDRMKEFWPELSDYHVYLSKLLRFRPHILGEKEERLLAMQEEANQTAAKAFQALVDVDLEFGEVETPEGRRPITNSTFPALMMHPNREVRRTAYERYMSGYEGHKNTLGALYAGSINLDVYQARARNYDNCRRSKLFPDDVPDAVYDNLVATVRSGLAPLHRYYELRRETLGLDKLRMYDVRVPLVEEVESRHGYEEAVELVVDSLRPLGDEYRRVLRGGLLGGWVDRYENRGKRSGAFSAGSFTGDPYILLNFKEELLRDVFTLAHEAGHSMHSWYSVRSNPFQHYHYTIFEAEVASTFNEELLFRHLLNANGDPRMRVYLINKRIDDIIGTLYRQTMFAEYEDRMHRLVETGRPVTVDLLRREYRELLEAYFGPAAAVAPVDEIEGLRIPHFYRSFYVYKYATGIAAALHLARGVADGGAMEREAYFRFLKSGGSRYPLDALKEAGVDMSGPEPIQAAVGEFEDLVDGLCGMRERLRGPD